MVTLIGSEFPKAYRCMAGIESDEEPCQTDCLSWTDISEGMAGMYGLLSGVGLVSWPREGLLSGADE